MRIGRIWWMAGAIACGVTSLLQGAIFTFGFDGTVAAFTNTAGAPIDIHVGIPVVFTYSFDSDAPHNNFPYSY